MGLRQFYDGTYPLADAIVYEGAATGWPPPQATPQDWLYTIGAWPSVRGRQRTSPPPLPFVRGRQARGSQAPQPPPIRMGFGEANGDWPYVIAGAALGQPVVREGGGWDWAEDRRDPPAPWLYTLGDTWRRSKRGRRGIHGMGLGDDTPDSIRIYVPRLAAGLYAIDLYETGLTKDAMPPAEPIESARWNDRLATKFSQEARRYLGFVPVVHEPAGVDVIFAHMAGAVDHASAERIWQPLQSALNRARNATGVGAPADPYAGTPRAYETSAPTSPEAGPPLPPATIRPRSGLDIILGIAMVAGGVLLF